MKYFFITDGLDAGRQCMKNKKKKGVTRVVQLFFQLRGVLEVDMGPGIDDKCGVLLIVRFIRKIIGWCKFISRLKEQEKNIELQCGIHHEVGILDVVFGDLVRGFGRNLT